jgi:hypothetical protein
MATMANTATKKPTRINASLFMSQKP